MSKLGTSQPAAATEAVLYTCPTARAAVINVAASNNGGSEAVITVAPSAEASSSLASERLMYALPALTDGGNIIEITAIPLSAGQKVFVTSSTGYVAFNCWGIEEIA